MSAFCGPGPILATCGRKFADIQPTSPLWAYFHLCRNPLPNQEFPIDRPSPEAYHLGTKVQVFRKTIKTT